MGLYEDEVDYDDAIRHGKSKGPISKKRILLGGKPK